tara:strand:- start:1336 stop:1641 length:306 start_codon:yes stop_codon:yes gene_type:complete
MGFFSKKIKITKIYEIYLIDKETKKGVITLYQNEKSVDKAWSWDYSNDLINPETGYPHLTLSVDTDVTIQDIVNSKIDLDNLENGEISMGNVGTCKVKRIQ